VDDHQNITKLELADPKDPKDFFWRFWYTLPIYPYSRRRTIRQEVIKDTIWTFEQLQGIFYVIVPVRMTVVRLESGGLLVYAPVAPTKECIELINELVVEYGSVKYIILPTISGLEHKVFVGPFSRYFPTAEVFVAPNQWSFPVNLPLNWLGLPAKRTKILPVDSTKTPFGKEFDYAILDTIDLRLGKFAEVAFLHKSSKTLLVTDSVVSIPAEAPEIIQLEPYPLLFHARDSATEAIVDNPANRRRGWQRIALFAMYFQPSSLEVPAWGQVFKEAKKAPKPSKENYFGLYPFKWKDGWLESFEALRGNGRLLVAPVLQSLILNRAPQETINWAEKVASWDFQQIIPCHLAAPISVKPSEFRAAFAFLSRQPGENTGFLPDEDFQILRDIDAGLSWLRIVPSAKQKV
jgi:Domain of unknown function (DUF4336)